MTNSFIPPNSVWPNGMQTDDDGYACFYPLGTYRTYINSSNEVQWPVGDKLISPFVYDANDNLVGFCDTKAMITDKYSVLIDDVPKYSYVDADFSALETAMGMFQNNTNIIAFKGNISSLYYGAGMFRNCSNLSDFDGDLQSLTNGFFMFFGCKLNTKSLRKIAKSIKDVTGLQGGSDILYNKVSKTIHIGLANAAPSEEEKGYLNEIYNKGWEIFVNGESNNNIFVPSEMTLEETGEETNAPIPYYGKPLEVNEDFANYIGEDGKYYIILGGQYIYVNDIETYGMFTCEADAAAQMRLAPYIKPQTTNE